MASASVSLPVTCRNVTPSRSRMRRSSPHMRARRLASSAPSGSSSSTRVGSATSVRARATRWRWPPEIAVTARDSSPDRPTRSTMARTRSATTRAEGRSSARFSRPKAMFCWTVRWGNSAKFWKTKPMLRRCAGRVVQRSTAKRDRAAVERLEPRDGAQQHGLARAAGAEQRHVAVIGHVERDAVEREPAAVALAHGLEAQDGDPAARFCGDGR